MCHRRRLRARVQKYTAPELTVSGEAVQVSNKQGRLLVQFKNHNMLMEARG